MHYSWPAAQESASVSRALAHCGGKQTLKFRSRSERRKTDRATSAPYRSNCWRGTTVRETYLDACLGAPILVRTVQLGGSLAGKLSSRLSSIWSLHRSGSAPPDRAVCWRCVIGGFCRRGATARGITSRSGRRRNAADGHAAPSVGTPRQEERRRRSARRRQTTRSAPARRSLERRSAARRR